MNTNTSDEHGKKLVLVFNLQEPDGHDGRQEAELEAEASIIRM